MTDLQWYAYLGGFVAFDKRLALMSAYQPPSVDNTAMICE